MLKGTNINLRALEPQDVELLFQWENDEANWHLSNTVAPISKFVLEQYVISSEQDIYTSKQLRLIIEINKDGANVPIGSIDLFDFEPTHKRAGIGILILKEYRNKGFASESLEMLIDYGFNTLHLHQPLLQYNG
ncbi:MAG: GNAT family N-acetyltransferase [Bacteroidales bacterium]